MRTGASFGLTSGVLTTLGLIVGLYSGTQSKLVVIGGIFTIAIADALSDALGMHVHEESERQHTALQIWTATGATFIAKLLTSLSFLAPVLLLDLPAAVAVSIVWGLLLLGGLSYRVAAEQGEPPWRAVVEHLTIAVAVVVLTWLVGVWIGRTFS